MLGVSEEDYDSVMLPSDIERVALLAFRDLATEHGVSPEMAAWVAYRSLEARQSYETSARELERLLAP